MKPTDASKPKYIIGNMVIPVTDEIKAKLKGDYSMEKLKKVFPAVFDRPHIHFLENSVMCVDYEGLDSWCSKSLHPDKRVELMDENLRKIRLTLDHLGNEMNKNFTRIVSMLWGHRQPKQNFFQRIFKRKNK